jgi:hypothetical protein
MKSLALIVLFLTHQAFVTPTISTAKEFVILNAGTPVSFKLGENKNATDLEVGNTILIITDDDVVVDGQTVIRKGERGEAVVNKIIREKGCPNCRDKRQSIDISVDQVKAVDGQKVDLFGADFTFRSACSKCPVELNTTMRLDAHVGSNIKIVVR